MDGMKGLVKEASGIDGAFDVADSYLVKKVSDRQVGGDWYKNLPIQPIDFILENGLGFCEGNVIKYVTRWKHKNGIEDLEKARHYIDMLIAEERSKDG